MWVKVNAMGRGASALLPFWYFERLLCHWLWIAKGGPKFNSPKLILKGNLELS